MSEMLLQMVSSPAASFGAVLPERKLMAMPRYAGPWLVMMKSRLPAAVGAVGPCTDTCCRDAGPASVGLSSETTVMVMSVIDVEFVAMSAAVPQLNTRLSADKSRVSSTNA